MSDDSLQYIPMERWEELERVFEADWPQSISVLTALKTQRQIATLGLGYGFKVYCPYGLPANGMVALNKKDNFNEIIIYCGINNIKNLENALMSTKLVDWRSPLTIPFLPEHLFKSIEKVAPKLNVEIENDGDHPLYQVVLLDKGTPLFENIT
ncbi:unnamed protein product [Diatraea saccharalis]|uniref:Uncharacterized protein n=1 Tax=Diatraea saccharalis TaxID=40085 RepID=A0A9N9RGB0_9NEOP|nr:unnamed protein product [Diatraea saccharalis]